MNNELTKEQLHNILHYNQETGVFTWLIKVSGINPGDIAGTDRHNDGKCYRILNINGKKYRAHRLAWLYVKGVMPSLPIDHINGDGCDNRLMNLREVTHIENNRNMRLRVDNSLGLTGVYWNKKDGKWQVAVKTEPHCRGYVGQFNCLLEAAAARFRKTREHNFHENHGSNRPL